MAALASCGQPATELHQVVLVIDTELCEMGDNEPEFSRVDVMIGDDVMLCATVGRAVEGCEQVASSDFPLVLPVLSDSGEGTVAARVELRDDAGDIVGCGSGSTDFVSGETRWATMTIPRACGAVDCSASILTAAPNITSLADLPGALRCTPSSPDPVEPIQRIAAGANHACLIDAADDLFCWGRNADGQLGLGDTADRTRPTLVEDFPPGPIVDVAAGKNHTCALLASGANRNVYCWGAQERGQVGNGTIGAAPRTRPLSIGLTAARLALGPEHSCALLTNGSVQCWGSNSGGEAIGAQVEDDISSPIAPTVPTELGSITLIAAGGNNGSTSTARHTCVTDGVEGACWGANEFRQLGRVAEGPAAALVTNMPPGVNQIALGGQQSCATTEAADPVPGRIYCWGENINPGTLGVETSSPTTVNEPRLLGTEFTVLEPPTPADRAPLSTLAAGDNFRCVVAADGGVECWGDNTSNRLGSEVTVSTTPTPILLSGSPLTFQQVVVGGSFGCALPDDGSLPVCWGDNSQGQLGTGLAGGSALPAQLEGCGQ